MERPSAGIHYPGSLGEFQTWFQSDADCLDYLEWLRWPSGFVCPECAHAGGWRLGDGRFMCTDCGSRTSVMAGTIFDRTRTPLTVSVLPGTRSDARLAAARPGLRHARWLPAGCDGHGCSLSSPILGSSAHMTQCATRTSRG